MTPITRRTMLEGSALGAAALAFGGVSAKGDDGRRVTVGIIGPGGMGGNHLRLLAGRKDVEVAYVCDVDANRLADAASEVEKRSGKAPKAERDMRKVLDDPKVEAVWIATPTTGTPRRRSWRSTPENMSTSRNLAVIIFAKVD